jgi:SulP family sulfate permease
MTSAAVSLTYLQTDPAQYSSSGLREQTAELASYALSDSNSLLSSHSSRQPSDDRVAPGGQHQSELANGQSASSRKVQEGQQPNDTHREEAIEEGSEPVSPELPLENPMASIPHTSALTQMIRTSPPSDSLSDSVPHLLANRHGSASSWSGTRTNSPDVTENTPLLSGHDRAKSPMIEPGHFGDLENQKIGARDGSDPSSLLIREAMKKSRDCAHVLTHPKTWNPRTMWRKCILHPASLLPAVFLGLLLNILDALSYGTILFPLGQAVFEDLGADGIAMFYVSTIIAQLTYSCGGSAFKGGVGSEMIEVVPFFHKMAFTILHKVGAENPKSVLATTILSFSLSSVLTGVVFFLMGACRLGSLIGFFPRHILIGCIGGVGWFLVATGVEVSARIEGNLDYNSATLSKLFEADTIFLWLIPLILAVVLLKTQRFVKSNFLVGGYFVSVALLFYFFKFAFDLPIETLRDRGWVFDAPPGNRPWYHFYTLYDFQAVNWSALAQTVPAMFALTFFGVLHVPINVPALGITTGEDNLNVDRELIAHGVSNALSGAAGSIQNYLVYTNSILFIDSGGDDRLAGLLLAVATFAILIAGPDVIGYIPIMVVGALIFLLGFELLLEALYETWGRLHLFEYLTVVIIVVTMGAWDFVVGILIGIILACISFVVQTSRKTAIKATYSGQVATSTVRRPPMQLKFLQDAGRQTFVIKLAGYLFFGTIVSVENRIRALLAEKAFRDKPIRFLVLDVRDINGVDFSAAEAFSRINRLLRVKDVNMIISGIDVDDEIGQSLSSVGLFNEENQVKIFEDLNGALEYCENHLLHAFYRRHEMLTSRHASSNIATAQLDVPKQRSPPTYSAETMYSSPRRHHLHQVAETTLHDEHAVRPKKWSSYKQPLPLLLQVLEGLSDEHEDFWFRAVNFFERRLCTQGSVLFYKGDHPDCFYLLEDGILRADYDLPQGRYSELIVSGRPCGELPFFSETARTATMFAEKDSVVWQLSEEKWQRLQKQEPDVAQELLKVSLKLTKERMDAVTAYVLTNGGS